MLLFGSQKYRKRIRQQNIGYSNRRIFLLGDQIAQDLTGELEKEKENMLEKRERVTVAATEILMSIYCI